MKKYILGAIICATTLFLASCNDYLDKYPENAINTNKGIDFTKKENMFNPVATAYSRAQHNAMTFWGQYGLLTVRGDDVYKGSSKSDQGELTYAKNFEYNQMSGYWALDGSFKNLHDLVREVAGSLELLERYNEHLTTPADSALNLQYKAEVRFLRAYAYFYIGRMWGKATFIDELEDVMQENPEVIKYDALFDYINTELDFCIANLPKKHPNEMPIKGQVTKYTALMLKAKVNADLAKTDPTKWDVVLSTTDSIINSGKFSLYPDFYKLFKQEGILCNESILEFTYGVLNDKVYESDVWFEFQGPRNGFTDKTGLGGGWGFITPSPALETFMNNRNDSVRFKTTFLFAGTVTQYGDTLKPYKDSVGLTDRVFNGKAYFPKSQMPIKQSKYGTGNSVRMLRYADCLLLNAEAKVRKGQNGDVPFNLVRSRAKLDPITNVTIDQIMDERRAELAMEWGERFFDLVRTNKAKDVLKYYKGDKENQFYPIPIAQSDLNSKLKD